MLLIIHLMFVGLFVLLGVVFCLGKGAGLIAGYNTASAAEKARYDEKKLCQAMGKLMFALAACWLLIAASEIFQRMALLWIGLGLFFAAITVGIIYINSSKKLRR